jgi:hypothetical protein
VHASPFVTVRTSMHLFEWHHTLWQASREGLILLRLLGSRSGRPFLKRMWFLADMSSFILALIFPFYLILQVQFILIFYPQIQGHILPEVTFVISTSCISGFPVRLTWSMTLHSQTWMPCSVLGGSIPGKGKQQTDIFLDSKALRFRTTDSCIFWQLFLFNQVCELV